MMERNYYALLGIRRTADLAEIRRAYVKRLKDAHPDLDRSRALPRARVEDLQRAYQCLRDADTRAEHDADLQAAEVAHQAKVQRMQRRLSSGTPRRRRRAADRLPRGGDLAASRWRAILLAAGLLLIALQYVQRR